MTQSAGYSQRGQQLHDSVNPVRLLNLVMQPSVSSCDQYLYTPWSNQQQILPAAPYRNLA